MCAVFTEIGSFSAAMIYMPLTWTPRESPVQGLSDSGPKTPCDLLAFNTYIWFILLLNFREKSKEGRERARIKGRNSHSSTF